MSPSTWQTHFFFSRCAPRWPNVQWRPTCSVLKTQHLPFKYVANNSSGCVASCVNITLFATLPVSSRNWKFPKILLAFDVLLPFTAIFHNQEWLGFVATEENERWICCILLQSLEQSIIAEFSTFKVICDFLLQSGKRSQQREIIYQARKRLFSAKVKQRTYEKEHLCSCRG